MDQMTPTTPAHFSAAAKSITSQQSMLKKVIADAKLRGDKSWLRFPEMQEFLRLAIAAYGDQFRKYRPQESIITHMIRVAHTVWNMPYKELTTHEQGTITAEARRVMTYAALAHDGTEEATSLRSKLQRRLQKQEISQQEFNARDVQLKKLDTVQEIGFIPIKLAEALVLEAKPNTPAMRHAHYMLSIYTQDETRNTLIPLLKMYEDDPALKGAARLHAQRQKMLDERDPNNPLRLAYAGGKFADKMDGLESDYQDLLGSRMTLEKMGGLEGVRYKLLKLALDCQLIAAIPTPAGIRNKVLQMKDRFYYLSRVIDETLRAKYSRQLTDKFGAEWGKEIPAIPKLHDGRNAARRKRATLLLSL